MFKLRNHISTIFLHYRYFGVLEALSLILVGVFGKTFMPFRDKMILRFLRKEFGYIVDKNRNADFPTEIVPKDAPIWTFWAQGEEKMPIIVKKCIELMQRNSNGRKVVILDMDSVRKFVDIPDSIYTKVGNKELGYAHFSDIIRCSLLAKYGGVWLDAGVLLTYPLPMINNCYYTIPGHMERVFSKKWTCGIQASVPNNPLHSVVRDILIAYHQKGLPPFEYLLLDYVMFFVYVEIPAVKQMVDNAQIDNPDFHFISRNRNKILNQYQIEQCFRNNIMLRASYQWKEPDEKATLYWQIFHL